MTVELVRVLLAIPFFYRELIWFSGPRSHVSHVIHFSVGSSGNLDEGSNEHAIKSNWGVNCVI